MSLLRTLGRALLFTCVLAVFAPSVYAGEKQTVVVFGASGRIGEVIVVEALERGHKVLGVSRKPEKLKIKHSNFTAVYGDLMDIESIGELAARADTFVISVHARASDNQPENSFLVAVTRNILEAFSEIKDKPYLLQVGGANLMYGSTYEEVKANMRGEPFIYEPGTTMYAVLFGHQMSVEMYRESPIEWSVIAPPIRIMGIYGDKDMSTSKGKFRISATAPLIDKDGNSTIYVRDFAKAALNEIENKEYAGKIFTVAY